MIKLSVRSPYYWAWQIDGTITLREVHGGRGTLPECIYRLVGIVMKISEDYLSLKMGEIPGFYDGTVSVRVMRWITDTSCTSNVSIGLICTQWLINPGDSHSDPRTQRGTGSHRESQRDTESHRESQRVTERHRESQLQLRLTQSTDREGIISTLVFIFPEIHVANHISGENR